MSGIAALLAEQAEAHPTAAGRNPVVAYVGDASTGEISVMSADREVTLRDPQLARRIAGLIR
jgi:hypothetical protein